MNKESMFLNLDNGFGNMLKKIYEEYQRVKQANQQLRLQIATWNKDDEIQKAYDQAESYRNHSLMQLTDSELLKIKQFRNKHFSSCSNYDTYSFRLSDSMFGTQIKITCPVCGETQDVTDYKEWQVKK